MIEVHEIRVPPPPEEGGKPFSSYALSRDALFKKINSLEKDGYKAELKGDKIRKDN